MPSDCGDPRVTAIDITVPHTTSRSRARIHPKPRANDSGGIRSRLLECCYLGTYPIQKVSNHHIEAEGFAASGPGDIASTAAS